MPLLKHAELDCLYGGFDKLLYGDEYLDLYGEVDKFLFASGENPFTKKALEKYVAGQVAGRQARSVDSWLDHVGVYDEYH